MEGRFGPVPHIGPLPALAGPFIPRCKLGPVFALRSSALAEVRSDRQHAKCPPREITPCLNRLPKLGLKIIGAKEFWTIETKRAPCLRESSNLRYGALPELDECVEHGFRRLFPCPCRIVHIDAPN